MAIAYTNKDKVQAMAKNLELKGDAAEATVLSSADINYFIDWSTSVINSNLSPMYFVPLQQIQRNGSTIYPDPIEFIATSLAAGWMVESVYSRIDSQISDAGKVHKEKALQQLETFALGQRRLEGQILRNQSNFINPQVAPLNPPEPNRFS